MKSEVDGGVTVRGANGSHAKKQCVVNYGNVCLHMGSREHNNSDLTFFFFCM